MNWDDIRYFNAVFQCQNISRAAKILHVSPQTVARKIIALESKLNSILFIRHPRGYQPTADAIVLATEVEKAESVLITLQNSFLNKSNKFSGTVRIAAPELIATEILLPAFKPFLDEYPDLKIELITGIHTVGIAQGEADIALRLIQPEQGTLTIKQIGTMSSALYSLTDDQVDLKNSKLIGWDSNIDLPSSRWLRRITGREPDLKLSSLNAQKAAIQAGLGIGILPCFIAKNFIRIKRPYLLEEPLWLVTHSSAKASLRIRLVYDEISKIIKNNQSNLHQKF
ncbi:MAG: LysR family transcriptional regulator [Acinetobacter venetianus]|uniref:LysR family transcriptional regulator n=1 Tax=Acinetobacter venetianus TaxID=52133 RepID=UPI003C716D41